ncbi:hypothetical protein BJ969_005758 [Saccharopolyspora gloriosae]|uniref:Uncharacterized protein n=1 Tax=Saccharopolyspora gloriosae TaxID=455344 RepID=A0A840NLD5_9PSEU|nr:hypothetical protein [Saccharopolyspora gloriosae]
MIRRDSRTLLSEDLLSEDGVRVRNGTSGEGMISTRRSFSR